jgi:hypothetical protein
LASFFIAALSTPPPTRCGVKPDCSLTISTLFS